MAFFRHTALHLLLSLMIISGLGARYVSGMGEVVSEETTKTPSAAELAKFSEKGTMSRPMPVQRHGLSQASLLDGAPKFAPLPFLPIVAVADIRHTEPRFAAVTTAFRVSPTAGSICARAP
jgi:hypothetical protein